MRIKEIEEMNPVDTATWLCNRSNCSECERYNKAGVSVMECACAISSNPIDVITEMGFHVVEESRAELLGELLDMEPGKEYRHMSGRIYRISPKNGHLEMKIAPGVWQNSIGELLTNLVNEKETLEPEPKYTTHDVEVAKAIRVLWPGVVAVKKNGSFMDGTFPSKTKGTNLAPIWPFDSRFDYWVDLDEIINSQTK